MTQTSTLLLIVFAILTLPTIVALIVIHLNGFIQELRYLNTEIARTTGKQREHWLRRRRRLWLSLIPFVRY